MNSPEFSFIQFSQSLEHCGAFLPVRYGNEISFYVNGIIDSIHIVSESGAIISECSGYTIHTVGNDHYIKLNDDLKTILAPEDYFRLLITSNGDKWYSNIFQYSFEELTSVLEYSCDSDDMGFKFSISTDLLRVRLPLRIYNPQHPQESKVYTTMSGHQKVLFASVNKEWLLETEYLDDNMHEKIIIALSSDNLLINTISLNKSDKYDIEWDNYIDTDCGKIAKATCKVQQNRTVRNSNCG